MSAEIQKNSSDLERQRILVVDDDPHMQEGIRVSLSRGNYEIVVVSDGLQAIEAIERNDFDLVITDQQMPQMSGLELLATLQQRESSIPIVMITAYGTITQAVEAMQLGAADFITKPFSSPYLLRVVERVLLPEVKASRQQAKTGTGERPIISNDP